MQTIESTPNSHSLTPNRIYFLDCLRALAIIMVVGVHTLGYSVALPQDLKEITSFIVQAVSVPVFFLVDGYLFARSIIQSKKYSCLKYVQNSLSRLIAPWAIFTLMYGLARYAFEQTGFLTERLLLGHTWEEVAISAYGSVYAPQMYFLFSLFLIRLCSPVLKQFLIIKSYFALLSIFLCYYAAYKLIIPFVSPHLEIAGGQEPLLHALWGIQFYLIGIVLFRTSEIVDLKKLFAPVLLLFISSLIIHRFVSYRFDLDQYLYLLALFLFFFTFAQGSIPLFDIVGRNTMGIYLLHAPIVLKGTSLILNKFIFDPMMSFVSILFVTLVLSMCIVMLINYVPYGCLLFGIPYRQKDITSPPVK